LVERMAESISACCEVWRRSFGGVSMAGVSYDCRIAPDYKPLKKRGISNSNMLK
jgi:hypothetical protein